MKWWFHPYVLEPAYVGSFRREGALLRVEFPSGAIGYADLHPWTSFGDLPLSDELALLRRGEPTRLSARALAIAERDAEARACNRSLWEGLTIPDSHWLSPVLGAKTALPPASEGYTRFKIKLGANPTQDISALFTLVERLPIDAKIRPDFNERLSPAQFSQFIDETRELHPRFDFLEDPCPDPKTWARGHGVPLAADRYVATAEADVLVVKPALHDPLLLARRRADFRGRWVVTSYLDHPLGQSAAAVGAGELARAYPDQVDICGLLSHEAYQPNAFSEVLRYRGPRFLSPGGTGLGFDEQLAALDWREA